MGLSNEEIIEKVQKGSTGKKFQRLWKGKTAEYDSPVAADRALCSLLAYWTNGDGERIDQLFRKSDLARPKWVEASHTDADMTYGEVVIQDVINSTIHYHDSKKHTSTDEVTSTASHNTSLEEENIRLRRLVEALKESIKAKDSRIEALEDLQMVRKDKISHLRERIEDLEAEPGHDRDAREDVNSRGDDRTNEATDQSSEAQTNDASTSSFSQVRNLFGQEEE
jgi:putative DNA primase/helicase